MITVIGKKSVITIVRNIAVVEKAEKRVAFLSRKVVLILFGLCLSYMFVSDAAGLGHTLINDKDMDQDFFVQGSGTSTGSFSLTTTVPKKGKKKIGGKDGDLLKKVNGLLL